MLDGCTPWPAEIAQRYRDRGYWQGITLSEMMAAAIRRHPAKTALVHGDLRVSYAALGESVDRLACGFVDAGIAPQDRVVVQLPNVPEFVYTYLALVRIGAIPVMALRAHRHAEVTHFLRASGAVAYVIPDAIRDFDYRAMAAEVAPACPALRTVFVAGNPGPGQRALSTLLESPGGSATDLAGLCTDPSEVVTMLLSGGTTSMSKLIPRTHDDYVLNARMCGTRRRLRRKHGAARHSPARPQLQSRLARDARRVLPRRHRCPRAVGQCSGRVRSGRARARDHNRRRRAAHLRLAQRRRAGAPRSRPRSR